MLNPIKINFKLDKTIKRALTTELMIKSHDINVVEFHIYFDSLELTADHTVKILSVFNDTQSQTNVTCDIADGKAIYRPDTSLISQDEQVLNYVYVYHGDQSLDVRVFTYSVDLSKIDETALKVKEVYDQSYSDLLENFEQALTDYKDSLPQASDLRAEVDVILDKFKVDSENAIGYLGEVSTSVENAEASRVENEYERVQAETERKEAELLREENYNQKVDTAIVEADVVEKVDNKVTELTPQIYSLAAQLAQITYNVNDFKGVNDNEKIVNAFAFMNNLASEGATLSFPQRESSYILSTSVIANGKWNLKMDKEIKYNGNGVAITLKDFTRRYVEIMVTKGTDYGGWYTDIDLTSVGVKFDNVNWCEVKLKDIRGFNTNVLFDNSEMKGSCYNNVSVGLMYDAFAGIYLKERITEGVTTSWNNQNQFYGGALKISNTFKPVKNGTCLFKNDGNNNTLIGIALEGDSFQHSILTTASDNVYINCRYEGNLDNSLTFEGTHCRFNTIIGGYALDNRILSIEKPTNVVVIGGGRIENLINSNSYPTPALTAYTAGKSTNKLLELGRAVGSETNKALTATGNGLLSLYDANDVTKPYPQVELYGRYGQLLLGDGTSETKLALWVDTSPNANLLKIENWNYEVKSSASLNYEPSIITITNGNMDISSGNLFKTNNTIPTTINTHTGGRNGKPIYLVAGDANTTVAHSSLIKLKGASSRLLSNGEVVQFLRIDGLLVEV